MGRCGATGYCVVTAGSWPLMTEYRGGRRQRKPRPDLGCSTNAWMEFHGVQSMLRSLSHSASQGIPCLSLYWPIP